jgi:hypothetical protein
VGAAPAQETALDSRDAEGSAEMPREPFLEERRQGGGRRVAVTAWIVFLRSG